MDNITDIRNWEHQATAELERTSNTTKLRVAEIPRHKRIGVVEMGLTIDASGCKSVFVVYDHERRESGDADIDFLCKFIEESYPEAEWVKTGLRKPWPNPGNLERLEKYDSAIRSVTIANMDIFGDEDANAIDARQLVDRSNVNWSDFIERLKAMALQFEAVDDHKLVYFHGKLVDDARAEMEHKRLEAEKNLATCRMLNSEVEEAGCGLRFIDVPTEGLYSVAKVTLPDTDTPSYLAFGTVHNDYAARINSYLAAVNAPEASSIEIIAAGIDPLVPFDMEGEGARRLDALLYEIGPKTDYLHAKLKEALACAVCKAIDTANGTDGQHVCDLTGSPLAANRAASEMSDKVADLERRLAESLATMAKLQAEAAESAAAAETAKAERAKPGLGPDTVVAAIFTESDVARALADAKMHVSPALINAVSVELRRSAESWAASACVTLSRSAVDVAQRKAASILCADIAAFVDAQATQMPFARGVWQRRKTGAEPLEYGLVGGEDGMRVSSLAASVEADRGAWRIDEGVPEALVLSTDAGEVTVRFMLTDVVESLAASAARDVADIFGNTAACITPPMKYALVSEFPQLDPDKQEE